MTNWKTILTFTYPHEAHPVKALLDSHHIPTFLKDEMTIQAHNFYSYALGGVKLQVPEDKFEKAYIILKESGFIVDKKERKKDIIEEVKQDKNTNLNICPFCKSENVSKVKHSSQLIYVIYLLLGLFLPIFRKYYRCYDCGGKWKIVKK
ncbi:MAG: DUF2007 domain-containing protein [Candidatus Delongbacteria bacterium]|jgi:hypothetical protein|nr:DUF2007 domain-containing protein [Candidatus Delongbacteria bacterium]